ncbi:INGR1 protein, partial [Rhinopomastus cyanomelas]|nr:INGR1 protein [Rhinopomastus cyanomelas]
MFTVLYLQSKTNFLEENCTTYKCRLYVPVPAEGSTYCITAEGRFCDDYMLGATAQESCIDIPLKQTLSAQYIIILCVLVLSLSLGFTVYCGCRKLRKKDIKLPKSLVSVIRKLNTGTVTELKSETKYISVIDFMLDQSVLPDSVEVTLLEVKPEVTPENSSEGASSVPLPEVPAKAEEGSVQDHIEEVSSDDEQNCKLKQSYFVSASGQMDVCSNSSGPEVPATEVQQTVLPSSCPKFSGYDKPHVPLDMLIDVGEEQPVFAYRPTD